MNYAERGALWAAVLAVFLVINPVAGFDARYWQEIVLLAGGVGLAVVALGGVSLLSAASLWIVWSAATHRGPMTLNAVFLLLCFLATFALARKAGAVNLIRGVVAVNVAAWSLQMVGLWLPLLRMIAPEAEITVHNALHPHAGLTSSTADLACVLAMGLPFLLAGRWRVLAVVAGLVLLSTDALSGIAAGAVGLGVALWPAMRARVEQGWRVAFAGTGALAVGVVIEQPEIRTALADERWPVWSAAAHRWIENHPLAGYGLGSWAKGNMAIIDPAKHEARVWSDMHFDLLQAGYELGAIGVALIVTAWAWLVARARVQGNHMAAGALCAAGVCQFGHFPFHLAAPLVVAALVAGEAARDTTGAVVQGG